MERVSHDGLRVGGSEPLLSEATTWGDVAFFSGRAAVDPETLEVVEADFLGQARTVLAAIDQTLRKVGSSREDVLRVTCYLTRADDFAEWNQLWSEFFSPPRPARTTVMAGSVVEGVLIEVEVTAGVGATGDGSRSTLV